MPINVNYMEMWEHPLLQSLFSISSQLLINCGAYTFLG
jgi:hypothetical protein